MKKIKYILLFLVITLISYELYVYQLFVNKSFMKENFFYTCKFSSMYAYAQPVEDDHLNKDESFRVLLNKADEYYSKGNYDEAIKHYEKVVELDSNYAPAYNSLGLSYNAKNATLKEIIWFYKYAVNIDPNYDEAYFNMCRAYYQAQEHELAEKTCLKALEINPNLGSAKLSLAWIYLLGKSQPSEAIYYFNEVIDKVKSPMIYFGLGMAYSMKGDRAKVLDVVTTLRSMGENQLASQLEKTIKVEIAPQFIQDIDIPENKPGTIIPSKIPPQFSGKPSINNDTEPKQKNASPPIQGTMKIRLKGKLTTVNEEKK